MPYKDPKKLKEYHARKNKEWYKKNPKKRAKIAHRYWQSDKGKEVKRRSVLKVIFWTPELWDQTYILQNGVCAICKGVSTDGRNLSADHDHEKETPRGLLCNECNFMLGKARDNPYILEAGAQYLRKFQGNAKKNSS